MQARPSSSTADEQQRLSGARASEPKRKNRKGSWEPARREQTERTPRRTATEERQSTGRCTPRATKHDHEPQDDRGNDHAREEQPFDTVLDRVENHEGEEEREAEQQQGTQERMPQPGLD
jgi:hypothetical protein